MGPDLRGHPADMVPHTLVFEQLSLVNCGKPWVGLVLDNGKQHPQPALVIEVKAPPLRHDAHNIESL